jgi:uncharacterized lipoprotein YddW (UPF0748 family)
MSFCLNLTAAVLLSLLSAAPQAAPALDPPEIRGLWVDAFHEGIRSQAEIETLIAAATRAHLNTLFVQVRRRGDALYTKGVEPPLDDPAYDPSFDALARTIEAAHAAGLQVHAWINAMPVWRDEAPPNDERHVFNRHGPTAAGDENWFTASPTGDFRFPVGYFLDPGHPAAAAYLAEIYLNIVRNYDVDGVHFDYVRYPETDERLPRGAGVGYNNVNLARFRRFSGRSDTPLPADEAWMAWRRQQVTNLVRRVSIEAKAIKPRVKISAALIPWGQPPGSERDFVNVAPMQRVYQDWHQWMKDGLLDLGVPMNYAAETDARVRGWFDGWIRWEKKHAHGRQLAIGLGAYRNTPEDTLAQIARARTPEGGARASGVSFFSYAAPQTSAASGDRIAFLGEGVASLPAPFPRAAPVPPMPWIDRPERGSIAGTVEAAAPTDADTIVVRVKRTGFRPFSRAKRVWTDGNGYFGLTNVKPGSYRVWTERRGAPKRVVRVAVTAGKVSRADL